MPRNKHEKRPSKKRDDSFESVAKRLGADESIERFEAVLGKIAKAKAKAKPKRRGNA